MAAQYFKIGIVGLGGVAQAHLQAIDLLDHVNVAAVCDVRFEQAQTVAAKYQAKPYSDYRQLITETDLDLLLVLTPASTHRAIVEACGDSRPVRTL